MLIEFRNGLDDSVRGTTEVTSLRIATKASYPCAPIAKPAPGVVRLTVVAFLFHRETDLPPQSRAL